MSAPFPDGILLSEAFRGGQIMLLRRAVAQAAEAAGLDESRRQDVVLAVDEIITNAVRHGGGSGRLDVWIAGRQLWFRVSDSGPGMPTAVPPPLPPTSALGGRGLWIARKLTDEMDIATGPTGTTVRGAVVLPGHA
jgi:serine/threonine-protein kinase RsbW